MADSTGASASPHTSATRWRRLTTSDIPELLALDGLCQNDGDGITTFGAAEGVFDLSTVIRCAVGTFASGSTLLGCAWVAIGRPMHEQRAHAGWLVRPPLSAVTLRGVGLFERVGREARAL